LIADGDAVFRNAVEAELTKRGYSVDACEEGLECLEKAGTTRPDLVIVDLVLPGIHGIDILTFLHNNPDSRGTRLIACSGKIFRPEVKSVNELGAIFIPKPVAIEKVADRVDQMLGRKIAMDIDPSGMGYHSADLASCFKPTIVRPETYVKFWGTRGSV